MIGGCWRHFKYEDDTCRTLPAGSCLGKLAVAPVLRAALQGLADPAPRPLPHPARAPRYVPHPALAGGR